MHKIPIHYHIKHDIAFVVYGVLRIDGDNFGTTKMDTLSMSDERSLIFMVVLMMKIETSLPGIRTLDSTNNWTLSILTYQSQRLISRATHYS